jgi:FAD/FMN-containing dehydrogenase
MQLTRRDIIRYGAVALVGARAGLAAEEGTEVNDIHSQLNRTRVAHVTRPRSLDQLRAAILEARREGLAVSISGSRHSMGGQQFGSGMVLLDTRDLSRVIALDPASRTIEAEAGIEWPELLSGLSQRQVGNEAQLGIFQKQTGADRLSLGGALASNVHGRGLNLKPFINDVESFQVMNAEGEVNRCDRATNPELFRLVIGGYGLFGVVTSVQLRLRPRVKVRRVVKLADLHDIPDAFAGPVADHPPHLPQAIPVLCD